LNVVTASNFEHRQPSISSRPFRIVIHPCGERPTHWTWLPGWNSWGQNRKGCAQIFGKEFGFTPPRADKSKRLLGTLYQFTLTVGLSAEIKDAEVERIRAICPDGMP
jgi:hypothetical protein